MRAPIRRALTIVSFTMMILSGLWWWLVSMPAVSADEAAEAESRLERLRESLQHDRCERPPLFGEAVTDALPLSELLSSTGPFGECWNATRHEELSEALRGGPWTYTGGAAADYASDDTEGDLYVQMGGAPYTEETLPDACEGY